MLQFIAEMGMCMSGIETFRKIECEQFLDNISISLQNNRFELQTEFLEQIMKIKKLIKCQNQNIAFVEISLLRHSIIAANKVEFCIELCNDDGMFGGLCYQKSFALPIFTGILKKAKNELMIGAKKYIGKIPQAFAEKIMLEYISQIDEILAEYFSDALSSSEGTEMKALIKDRRICCTMGEYRRFHFKIV